MQSFLALALWLALTHDVDARVTRNNRALDVRIAPRSQGVMDFFFRLLGKKVESRDSSNDVCVEDDYYYEAQNSSIFCSALYSYPDQTTTIDYTPSSTYTDITTTTTSTVFDVDRTTPLATVTATVTPGAKMRRDAQITAPSLGSRDFASEELVANVFDSFRKRDAGNGTTPSNAEMTSSFSSACSCQTYGGSTISTTYTDEQTVITEYAFARTTVTISSIRTDGTLTSTVVVTANSAATPSLSGTVAGSGSTSETTTGTTSSSAPTPIGPSFTCPEDNNSTQSQLIDGERFDYLVLCDYDLMDVNFYGALYYNTYTQCISACSSADHGFNSPVCQGASYFDAVNNAGYNCFLKSSANQTVPAVGVDSVLLQRIEVGISPNNSAGTETESAPFSSATPTQNPSQLSSSFSAMMGNRTSSMPMITPGPAVPMSGMLANPDITYYSETVIDGSTYSSGTAYSTYVSTNGSWYYAYYTTFTEAWASSTVDYIVTESSVAVANSSNTITQVESGDNGGYSQVSTTNYTTYYPGGYNVTEVISNSTFASNGTEIASSATTNYYSYATGGIVSGSGVGSVASAAATTTSSTMFVTSGSTAGGSFGFGSGIVGSNVASTAAITNVNSYGSAYASGYVTSAVIASTEANTATEASGAILSPTPSTPATTIVNSHGNGYSSGYIISGIVTSTGSAVSGASGTGTSATTIVSSYGTGYASSYIISGFVTSTGSVASKAPSTGTPASPSMSTSESTELSSYGTAYAFSYIIFGSGSALGGSSGFAASGSITTPAPVTSSTVILTSGGTAYSSGFVLSGLVGSTGGSSEYYLSGIVPPSESITPSPSGSALSSRGYSFGAPSDNRSPYPTSSESLSGSISSSRGYSFGAPSDNRSPYPSSASPSGTAPSEYLPSSSGLASTSPLTGTGPLSIGPSPYPSTPTAFSSNAIPSANTSSGTAPFATGLTAYSYSAPSSCTVSSSSLAGTAPVSYSFGAPSAPRAETTSSSSSTGTAPLVTAPIYTDTVLIGTATTRSMSGFVFPPHYTGPPLATASHNTGTPLFIGTAPTTCAGTTTLWGTTTIYETTISYACYSDCPVKWGGYGGPQPFGPPYAQPT